MKGVQQAVKFLLSVMQITMSFNNSQLHVEKREHGTHLFQRVKVNLAIGFW